MFSPLQIAYAANILILVPVLVSMFADGGGRQIRAMQNQVQNSDGLRLLVASFWLAILLLSVAGLFQPDMFVMVLVLQVVYKLAYLIVYVVPTARIKGFNAIPQGLSVSFLAIVVIWPVILYVH